MITNLMGWIGIVVAKDNSSTVRYVLQSSTRLSAYEYVIPDNVLLIQRTPSSAAYLCNEGADTGIQPRAEDIAQNQAQQSTLLAQITIDPQAMAEIQNALAAGKEVTTHALPITQSGWTG